MISRLFAGGAARRGAPPSTYLKFKPRLDVLGSREVPSVAGGDEPPVPPPDVTSSDGGDPGATPAGDGDIGAVGIGPSRNGSWYLLPDGSWGYAPPGNGPRPPGTPNNLQPHDDPNGFRYWTPPGVDPRDLDRPAFRPDGLPRRNLIPTVPDYAQTYPAPAPDWPRPTDTDQPPAPPQLPPPLPPPPPTLIEPPPPWYWNPPVFPSRPPVEEPPPPRPPVPFPPPPRPFEFYPPPPRPVEPFPPRSAIDGEADVAAVVDEHPDGVYVG